MPNMIRETRRDPWLLTPGPLTTSATVKAAMLHDWGSRDHEFIRVNREVRERLVRLAGGEDTHVCVPVQGSGTFVLEAMVGTMVPRDGRLLVLVNGAYGRRVAKMCDYYGRAYDTIEWDEDEPVDPATVDGRLAAAPSFTHVLVMHCETTSGILNPVERVAEICARHGAGLLIDAMSAFGAIPLDARMTHFDALVASSNKCIEGAPGVGFAVIRKAALEAAKGNAASLSLDLYDQWEVMEKTGQWRFTPPTHVIMALREALREHEQEGGVIGRGVRYRDNCRILVEGMRKMGFQTLLPDALQAPIIVTFYTPADPRFSFQRFYDALCGRGFVIYPGKLTVADSFRIGCIGRLGAKQMRDALAAIRETLREMGVTRCGPSSARKTVA